MSAGIRSPQRARLALAAAEVIEDNRPGLPGEWCERVAEWGDDVSDVYVVVNNHYEGHAPATVRALAAELRERHVAVAVGPGRPAGQQPLF